MNRSRPLRVLSPLHRAARQVSLALEPRMAVLGLGNAEGHLLGYACVHGPCTVAELARVFGLKPSTLTSVLDRLVARGFTTRSPDPEDRRSVRVAVTPHGRATALRARALVETLERAILARSGAGAMAGFRKVMQAVGEACGVEVRPTRPGTRTARKREGG